MLNLENLGVLIYLVFKINGKSFFIGNRRNGLPTAATVVRNEKMVGRTVPVRTFTVSFPNTIKKYTKIKRGQ